MRPPLGSTMRVLHPAPGVFGFYDGRIPGVRAWSDAPNWLDDGAYELGICTYAIVDGTEALVYDTHISLDHARLIRGRLEAAGVRDIRVVLSHWHDDHVAGNAVFADCEIIANRLTAALMDANREAIKTAEPPIRPLVMPNRLFEDSLALRVGGTEVTLRQMDIHSQDGTVMLLPGRGLLLAGDTLEDPITYVGEPGRLAAHLRDLDRLAALPFERILPDHGDPEIIAGGGYGAGLIAATRRYVERLMLCATEPGLAALSLEAFLGEDAHGGAIRMFAPYDAVHRRNVDAVRGIDGAATEYACPQRAAED
jgi:glyoxylase-like metal-dependent hydrolase (beta-lactamase superfamily II)